MAAALDQMISAFCGARDGLSESGEHSSVLGDSKFGVIVADPPWRFTDRLRMSATRRGAAAHYSTMSVAELVALPLANIVAPSAVLALWTPAALLKDGLAVLEAWGFASRAVYIWAKSTKDGRGLAFGMGHLFRGCAELALIGKRGSMHPTSRSERNVSLSPALHHSKKPEHLQDSLDRMFPGAQKLEIFARRARPGWTCIGNESPSTHGEDVRESLRSLQAHAGELPPGLRIDEHGEGRTI